MLDRHEDEDPRPARQHRIMTVATVRPDGWPQATTVGFVSDGLTLYFLCSRDSQKAANLGMDNRVSLTIDADTADPMAIEGLSMAARAYPVSSQTERAKALGLMPAKYSGICGAAASGSRPGRGLSRRAGGDLGSRLSPGLRPFRPDRSVAGGAGGVTAAAPLRYGCERRVQAA